MDIEKQRKRRHNDARLAKNGNTRSEQLLVMPTELLTNREWLPGELLSGSELRRSSWVLAMNYFFYAHGLSISAVPEEVALKLLTSSVSESFHNSFLQLVMTTVKSPLALHTFHRLC